MLDFVILQDNRENYNKLFLDIDNKIYQISRKALFNAKYGLTDKINYNLASKLSIYKDILKWKLSNDDFCEYNLKDIVGRVKRLISLDGPLPYNNKLPGCLPGQC